MVIHQFDDIHYGQPSATRRPGEQQVVRIQFYSDKPIKTSKASADNNQNDRFIAFSRAFAVNTLRDNGSSDPVAW